MRNRWIDSSFRTPGRWMRLQRRCKAAYIQSLPDAIAIVKHGRALVRQGKIDGHLRRTP